jgi:hypothetical protein
VGEFPRRDVGGVHLPDQDLTGPDPFVHVDADAFGACEQDRLALLEGEDGRVLPARRCRSGILQRERRLAAARRAGDQRRGATVDATTHQRIELGDAAGHRVAREPRTVFGGLEPRVHGEPPAPDRDVLVAAAEIAAAELHDLQLAQRAPVGRRAVVERDHAVGDALQLRIRAGACAVVEHQDRGLGLHEVLAQP